MFFSQFLLFTFHSLSLRNSFIYLNKDIITHFLIHILSFVCHFILSLLFLSLFTQKTIFKFLAIYVISIISTVCREGHAYSFPKYQNLDDAYARAQKSSGALDAIVEFDRLAEMLSTMRPLEFGMATSWSPEDRVKYKGCEPLITHYYPVTCEKK